MKKSTIKMIIVVAIVLAIASGGFGTYSYCREKEYKENLQKAQEEAMVITEYFVSGKLEDIGEFYTEDYTYSVERNFSDYRKVFGVNVPFTEKSLTVIYSGKVKAGYDVSEMDLRINEEDKVIVFKIPDLIYENYITKEMVKDEENNIFNPIEGDDYEMMREGVLSEGLANAVSEGMNDKAEESLKCLIKETFEQYGYHVKFI